VKAAVCRGYGSPEILRVEDVDRPSVPDDGVLVRVHAASLNPADFFTLTRVAYVGRQIVGRLKPKPAVPGIDFAGTVQSVGRNVRQFQVGEEVFGGKRGAFAEFVCVPEQDALVRKPSNVTFEEAAGAPVAALTALQAIRDHARLSPGQSVLVNGASGGVGTFAVQIARAFGARVTAVCSARNAELARSLGADAVIDYASEDFTRCGQRFDVMLDIAGNRSWAECTRVLAPNAAFVAIGGAAHTVSGGGETVRHLAKVRLASLRDSRGYAFFIAKLNQRDLQVLHGLLESGVVRTVLDERYALSGVVDAFRQMSEGHLRGKIIINV
jgi:NADPH:quinone reductase-like Zn-dependent oxidoreductase